MHDAQGFIPPISARPADADTRFFDVPHAFDLADKDAEALGALIEAEFDTSRVDPGLRDRAERVAEMLGVLEHHHPEHPSLLTDGAEAPVLVDVTLARVAQASLAGGAIPALSPDDEDTLDLLVASGYSPARVPRSLRARASRQSELLSLLGVWAGSDAQQQHQHEDATRPLVGVTLDRVQGVINSAQTRLTLGPAMEGSEGVRRRGLQFADLLAAASVALVGGAVVLPMLGAVRDMNRRMNCQANMMTAGVGFGQYASDFREMLPLATESRPGVRWWDVGVPERSNSANLFTLARTNYTALSNLACAGNPRACASPAAAAPMDWASEEQVSYSYQNLFASERPRWTQAARIVVMVDRSPIIPLARTGQVIDPLSNSLNHDGQGQNMLYNDGSAVFARSPVLDNRDNVYLPRPIEQVIAALQEPRRADPLSGTESPASADDVFVGP